MTAVFQDFVRYELPLRDNVAPQGPPTRSSRGARGGRADDLADLDTLLAKGYAGGTDLSGGQWQRVALARAICGVELGAGLILLDEPTRQLDVRGEAEIFERLLEATRAARRSSSPTGSRPCAWPIASPWSTRAGRRASAPTTSCMRPAAATSTMYELQASRFVELDDTERRSSMTRSAERTPPDRLDRRAAADAAGAVADGSASATRPSPGCCSCRSS